MTPPVARAWIRLPSGRHLDLINPSSDAWLDTDLATRLARTYRWGGESRWPLPLSVAQHSLSVLALRRQLAPQALDRQQALMELLHDAEEAFLGFDCIAPLKAVLGAPFQAVSDRIAGAILSRYRLQVWQEADHVLHKQADVMAAASEAVHCVGWSRSEVRDVLGINQPVLDTDPLVAVYGGAPWEPWPPELAAKRFLDELESLLDSPESTAGAFPACRPTVRLVGDGVEVRGRAIAAGGYGNVSLSIALGWCMPSSLNTPTVLARDVA